MELLLIAAFFILGAIIASFVGVVTERLYTGVPWSRGRSRCDSCARELPPFTLVPIISWALLGGRCFSCRARIPARHALSELALGTLFSAAYLAFGLTLPLAPFLAALAILCFIVLYDLRHTIVPQGASALLVLCALLFAVSTGMDPVSLGLSLMTAGLIGLAFLLAFVCSRGRAMGLGDAPVAFALSLLAGTSAIAGLVFSFWIGAAIGVGILVSRPRGHRMGIEVPFAPFLAAGYLLALFTQWNPFLF